MLKLIVCIKQVPMVSELPWDAATGTLRRHLAAGMLNPACRSALEAALTMKQHIGAHLTVLTMGPATAEEVLREAIALGADQGLLLCDPVLAGADTLATSYALAQTIRKACADFDLILCGCHTADSETAQVGPQLMEALDIPGVSYVDRIELQGRTAVMQRHSDNFDETLEMTLPGLITVTTQYYRPRYVPLSGLQDAFGDVDVRRLSAADLDLDTDRSGARGSATQIVRVFSPTTEKNNLVMHGTARSIVDRLFAGFEDRIGGAIGQDIKDQEEA
jgi:electron transfer flavoprotein beta subunit